MTPPRTNPTTHTTRTATTTLEVCQGLDCFGSGGGAAILEIEELVQEYSVPVQLKRGGCRNFCTMGPNVHYGGGEQFTRVVGPTECQDLVEKIDQNTKQTESQGLAIPTKLLLRQAQRQRWQALRLLARIRTSPTRVPMQQIETVQQELQSALDKEERAIQNLPMRKERCERRKRRLLASLQEIVQENQDLSESEDEEN